MTRILQSHCDNDGLLFATFDQPGRSANTLGPQLLGELEELLGSIERGPSRPRALIFTSAKPDVFISGADLFALREMDTRATADFLHRGQAVFERIAHLPIVSVAAINGHCMGGGLELALACTYRVAADSGAIQIGLPEVKLGILPGWGGTVRSVKKLGLRAALPLVLTGKLLPPRKAKKLGVIDEVVSADALMAAARRLAVTQPPAQSARFIDRCLSGIGPLRRIVLAAARQSVQKETLGNYPAPLRALEVIEAGCRMGERAGLEAERRAVTELAATDSTANLMRLFYLRQDAKKNWRKQLGADGTPVHQAAVVGGGVMGSGIVSALVQSGVRVRLIDVNGQAISAALQRIDGELKQAVRSGRISPLEARQALDRVIPSTGWQGLGATDLAVEAVAERLDVKHEVFRRLEAHLKPQAVLATNTSSLKLQEIGSVLRDRGRFIGLHFFNPVSKMPLVEVVGSPDSRPEVLATGCGLAVTIGKLPVLVGDGPGFLVNRVLIPYLAEALAMAQEGADIERIDRLMRRWGMPMGPFDLMDQVGLDIAVHIFRELAGRMPLGVQPGAWMDLVLEKRWLGRKSGRGFYVYDAGRKPIVNRDLLQTIRQLPGEPASDEQAVWRLLVPMVHEAARLMDEGVVSDADTIDLATVLGLGLAPFRGGLIRFVDQTGLETVLARSMELSALHGPRFVPPQNLRQAMECHRPMASLVKTSAASGAWRRTDAARSLTDGKEV